MVVEQADSNDAGVESSTPAVDTPRNDLPVIDTSKPHPARVYDYWLGGKDNFAADREAGEQALLAYPELALAVRANRAFLARAVRHLVKDAGIRQFLDIGTGIPTGSNTHEVAQSVAPESRVVYVDNDPIVMLHARALLTSTPEGVTEYIEADLRDADKILTEARRTLDFSQPTALMLLAILQFIPDDEDPWQLVSRVLDALAPGSHLVISHPTNDFSPEQGAESIRRYNDRVPDQATLRGSDGTSRFFDGLDLLEPGVVPVAKWRPDSDLEADSPSSMWCGVARKP
jgi:trans-aconitate methyltransferase